ncbi:hypothetical protein NVV93_09230 [Pseudomonas sp. LS44]|uniref:hypothetical protein n=1 Tax=Pseudomonas sp. LS44 TaxID=1357074 RepID=UPI00215B2928|nr:hypothetical protein [Pseudomonas sp. LS44]UVE19530.1 hypothetical protein NVV93_09230 [Pseudomonas sp. LS44]
MTTARATSYRDISPDELDMWVEIYADARIGEISNKPFSEFIRDPWNELVDAGQESALDSMVQGFRPLLPAQAATAKRIQAEWTQQDRSQSNARPALRLVRVN